MDKIKVSIINKMEHCSSSLISNFTKMTFSKKFNGAEGIANALTDTSSTTNAIAQNILKMDHSTILEHQVLTFSIEGFSRACQLAHNRHRMASITANSTHYFNYSTINNIEDYFVTPIEIMQASQEVQDDYKKSCQASIKSYCDLIKAGIKCEDARNVLPNSFRSSEIWTVNLRSLKNYLKLRLCGVNVSENIWVAYLIWKELAKVYPDLISYFGPDCMPNCGGVCKQGKRVENCIFKGFTEQKMREKFAILFEKRKAAGFDILA